MLSVQFTVIVWQSKFYGRKADACKAQGNAIPPEYRLPSMMICAPILPIGLFIFAWTSYADVFWLAPCIGTFLVRPLLAPCSTLRPETDPAPTPSSLSSDSLC